MKIQNYIKSERTYVKVTEVISLVVPFTSKGRIAAISRIRDRGYKVTGVGPAYNANKKESKRYITTYGEKILWEKPKE